MTHATGRWRHIFLDLLVPSQNAAAYQANSPKLCALYREVIKMDDPAGSKTTRSDGTAMVRDRSSWQFDAKRLAAPRTNRKRPNPVILGDAPSHRSLGGRFGYFDSWHWLVPRYCLWDCWNWDCDWQGTAIRPPFYYPFHATGVMFWSQIIGLPGDSLAPTWGGCRNRLPSWRKSHQTPSEFSSLANRLHKVIRNQLMVLLG